MNYFRLAIFSRVGRFTYAVFCLRHLLPYVGNIGTICTNGITNRIIGKTGIIGKTLNGGYVRGSPNGKICKSTNGTIGSTNGTIGYTFSNGNPKTLNVFLLSMVPMLTTYCGK